MPFKEESEVKVFDFDKKKFVKTKLKQQLEVTSGFKHFEVNSEEFGTQKELIDKIESDQEDSNDAEIAESDEHKAKPTKQDSNDDEFGDIWEDL